MASKTILGGIILLIVIILAIYLFSQPGYQSTTTPVQTETETKTQTQPETQPTSREIVVDAVDYEFKPSTITVKPGETIKLTVKNSGERFHTFTIDELGIDVPLNPGDEKTIELTIPSDVTSITFYCRPHKSLGMVGEFTVTG